MGLMTKDDRSCIHCYGSGRISHPHAVDGQECSECRGTGANLTEVGREIVAFIREYKDKLLQ